MTREVLLATCAELPALTRDDEVLRTALENRGARVRVSPWSAVAPEDPTSLVCLRSTWDYHRRWPEFRRWIEAFSRTPGRLWNPPATVLWNADKIYLRELAERRVALPATRWYAAGERPDIPAFFRESGVSRAVLKPRVSATAFGTHLLDSTADLRGLEWDALERSGSLVQAFVPEITNGEVSLVFVDGAYSHAIHKQPAAGDYRVQKDFGGRFSRIEPSSALRAFAEGVLEAASRPWVYARVDVVATAHGPTLMELELIEPDLFLATAPPAAHRLAAALLDRAARAAA
jgi:glutathione synthase/RimK-type ligase-like ATP-grasp enzyme